VPGHTNPHHSGWKVARRENCEIRSNTVRPVISEEINHKSGSDVLNSTNYSTLYSRTFLSSHWPVWFSTIWFYHGCSNLHLAYSNTTSVCQPICCHHCFGISRTSTIKIFGVTISNKLSISDHITNIVSKRSHTQYTLTLLWAHGLRDTALQSV